MTHSAMSAQGIEHSNYGTVTSVRGSVVDIRFDEHLPPIYSVLRAGKEARFAIEVLMQPDTRHVRGIACSRGMAVVALSDCRHAPRSAARQPWVRNGQ